MSCRMDSCFDFSVVGRLCSVDMFLEEEMIEFKPCVACGSESIDLVENKLDIYPSWYIRCKNCTSPCTVTKSNREEVIKAWNDLWCWSQIDQLQREIVALKEAHEKNLDGTVKAVKLRFDEAITKLQAELDSTKEELAKKPKVVEVAAKSEPLRVTSTGDTDWKYRYDKLKDAYIKTRLEVSGSFGNWDYFTKRRVLENEISNEVGFTI